MKSLKEEIQALAEKHFSDVLAMRRHIHMHPELSYQEVETSSFVVAQLQRMGLEVRAGIGGHGLTAFIRGKNPDSRLIALRADMDALPIQEQNTTEYRSKRDGVMHACGHDVHTSSLLGAAIILHEIRDRFQGTIQLVFQPAEEVLPGGASLMLKDGVFAEGKPQAIVGQHVYPELPAGKVGLKPGVYMASTDELYVTVKGRGGHGAKPNRNIDPVLIASHLIVALQQVVSRWSNPAMPSVRLVK